MVILFFLIVIILILSVLVIRRNKEIATGELEQNTIEVTPEVLTPDNSADELGEKAELMEEFNSAEKVEYTYTLENGTEYKIKIPKGVEPPPQTVVEKMYRIEIGEN